MTKKVIINALLAGFWAGLAVFAGTQEFSKTAAYAALAVAARAAYGYLSENVGPIPQLPVDR